MGNRVRVLREMDEHAIVLSLLHLNEPADVDEWAREAPNRFLAGPTLPCWQILTEDRYFCFTETQGWPDPAWLERELAEGRIKFLGESVQTSASPSS